MVEHLYLHVPFCNKICSYCDFAKTGYQERLVEKWLKVVAKELEERVFDTELATIYIGGGTPSSLSVQQLEALLLLLKPYTKKIKEYTIEANPESLSIDKLYILKSYGINRISLGVQSTHQELLDMMNRSHCYTDVKEVIAHCIQVGICNISVDLMYSLPNQTMQQWEETLYDIVQLPITHISLYSLTIEDNTVFKKKQYESLPIEMETKMYQKAIHICTQYGFIHYEISNFAKDGKESLHNKAYWKYKDFYGISLGASGKIQQQRYDNTRNFKSYLNHEYIQTSYQEDEKEVMFNMIMMSLRMKEGLSLSEFKRVFQKDIMDVYQKPLQKLLELKYLVIENQYLKCQKDSFLFLHDILIEFLD
ncbi:radical SAM family heme chaperone HemW [Erysipelotrichaceae bacterium OH741_COT-311]|nr:radical SAM family heme chaperone HemW [Erysipelotrichaceae bacterium OH741_COT-311]